MKTTVHLYENFGVSPEHLDEAPRVSEEEIEEGRLASFEAGYSSGWEDATRAHEKGKAVVSDALKDCLNRAEFSKNEAFSDFVLSSQELISGIVQQVLPEISQKLLGQHIREIIVPKLETAQKDVIVVSLNPGDCEALKEASMEWLPENVELTSDQSLKTGQACVSLGKNETHIDIPGVISEISVAIDAFFHMTEENIQHG